MLVRNDAAGGNVITPHKLGGETGGAVDGGGAGVAPVFAHLDSNRLLIAIAFVVGVLSLFVGG